MRLPFGRQKGYKIDSVGLVEKARCMWEEESKDIAGLVRVAKK